MAKYFQQQQGPDFSLDFGAALPAVTDRRLRWIFVAAALVLLFVAISFLRGVYTDLLWFEQLGFRSIFLKVVYTRIALFAAGAVIFAVPASISLYFAYRLSRGPEEQALPPATRDFLRKLIIWGAVAAVLVLSVVFGTLAAAQWEAFLRLANATPFGIKDPVYNNDVSFYVFTLPVYDFVRGWLLGAAIAVLLASLGYYFVNFSFRGAGFQITPAFKIHVSIIAAFIMFVLAFGHWLDRWALVLSDQGAVYGAAYADLNARRPALAILTVIAAASGVLILVNAYMRGIRLLVGGLALWAVMAFLLGTAWPTTMQRLTVRPNEFAREEPYIARSIEFTRAGFGLSDIAEEPYPVNSLPTADLVRQNQETIDNIRLWDHGPLARVYRQIQLIRPYYDFEDADVDRYTVDGEYRQVMLAAREVAHEKLEAQTWINTRLRYTHGFGLAMSPVTEFTPEGRPQFFAKDIPPDGVISIQREGAGDGAPDTISNPRIYYGEKTTDYVIVDTKTEELDFQGEGGEVRSNRYDGAGGVPIGSFIRKVAYAWQLADINILITGEITSESRIQYRREIQERISTVAPFLLLDSDPYLVAADGQLFWVQDAYTASDRYPYSEPDDGPFNYIRNSVKVVLDAYNGSLRFYVWDPDDPMIRTYQSIFPKLFSPRSEMPESLQSHVRYPQDLFRFQAVKYLKYHMTKPVDFYNLEDLWAIPNEKFGQGGDLLAVQPYYAIMKLPEEDEAEFILLLPYTRNEPPILAGWLAARNDGDRYGELISLSFPKDRQLDSPIQIEAKIDNDKDISPELTLLCQQGSDCIRGNLLVLPLSTQDQFSLLYAEPVYLQAEGVEFPELKKVILASQERVVMRDSVLEAINALTGFVPEAAPPAGGVTETPEEAITTEEPLQAGIESVVESLEDLKRDIEELEEALDKLSKELTEGGQ
jgi:uncharacterized membrane protein (UPF0182 family)